MFQSARLKLTAWYLLIITLVSLSFSVVIYTLIGNEIDRFARNQELRIQHELFGDLPPSTPPLVVVDPDLVNETKHRLLYNLIAIDGAILIASGVLGYLLAGRTLEPIRQMVDEQNRFISDSSHELRTPLTALKSTIEVNLRDKKLTLKEAKTLLKENIDEVNKLQLLSEELLKFSRLQKPVDHTVFVRVDVSDIAAKAVAKVNPIALNKKITLVNSVKTTVIDADPVSLQDLLVILLDNAIKYSSANTKINLTSKRLDHSVLLQVIDHGIGIDAKDLPHIFDRFYRADSARTKTDSGGFGLGLSIARRIVEVHQGTITAVSQPGQGTTFTLRLPLKHFS